MNYELLLSQAQALMDPALPEVSNLANCAALLFYGLEDVSWAGFYLARGETLFLGPFQGKTACVRIPFDRGVCGAAAQTRETQLVPDVHAFPGHIACDSASRSEIVIPLVRTDGSLFGVLDLDSTSLSRFTAADREGLEALGRLLMRLLDRSGE
ncbi:MAG: GAF domain-containing protein [Clostridia bacterium]|nr:GAF domain-containing protein [Clostridia bacterium]